MKKERMALIYGLANGWAVSLVDRVRPPSYDLSKRYRRVKSDMSVFENEDSRDPEDTLRVYWWSRADETSKHVLSIIDADLQKSVWDADYHPSNDPCLEFLVQRLSTQTDRCFIYEGPDEPNNGWREITEYVKQGKMPPDL